ncbi:MAG: hypothetical protein J0L96_06415 [Anaerolineae bacterium]|jgi:hypothetical protein|nr:hypothetical protein [Anaerolineae bacterium]
MNKNFALFVQYTQKISSQHIQLALVLMTLAMLVIGVGAPMDNGGGVGPR